MTPRYYYVPNEIIHHLKFQIRFRGVRFNRSLVHNDKRLNKQGFKTDFFYIHIEAILTIQFSTRFTNLTTITVNFDLRIKN